MKSISISLVFLLLFVATSVQSADQISAESLSLLKDLVNINSGTQNTKGLEAVRQKLIPEFTKIGFEAKVLDGANDHKVLVFETPNAKPELVLMGHVDTVFSTESKFQTFEKKGDHYYGPGIIDMKGGLVLIKDVMASLDDKLKSKIRVIINDDEEIGSPHTRAVYLKLLDGIRGALVFEPALPDGTLVTSQSGVYWLKLSVKGKASHAGLEPEKGTSACIELGHKITQIHELTDLNRKLLVNPGTLKGGLKPNVVCENAETQIDIRFVAESDLKEALTKIDDIASKVHLSFYNKDVPPTGKTEFIVKLPSLTSKNTGHLYKLAQSAGAKLGWAVKGQHVGYGSDANHLSSKNIDLLVGLGPYGQGMHTDEEFLDLKSYGRQKELSLGIIKAYLTKP